MDFEIFHLKWCCRHPPTVPSFLASCNGKVHTYSLLSSFLMYNILTIESVDVCRHTLCTTIIFDFGMCLQGPRESTCFCMTVSLDKTVKILSVKHRCFEKGVKEAIYIQTHKPSLDADGGRYMYNRHIPPVWNNLLESRIRQRTGP